MIRRFWLIMFVCILAETVSAQQFVPYQSRWQIRATYGVDVPFNQLFTGSITDHLIEYTGPSQYLQFLSVAWFFHRRWGVELSFHKLTGKGLDKRADLFLQRLYEIYASDYFLAPSTGALYSEPEFFAGNFARLLFGVIHRYEKGRFFIYPKFSIGSFDTFLDWGNVYLKEMNSNRVLQVSYDLYNSDKRAHSSFLIAASAAGGIKLTKRFSAHADVMASTFRANFTYEKVTTDRFTDVSTTEFFPYNKTITGLSFGAGLTYTFR